MRAITLEEHYMTPSFIEAVGAMPTNMESMQEKMLDLGEGRIAAMDAGGIDVQVLSLAANGFDRLHPRNATPLACRINDELAEAIRKHPTRLAGFATLGMRQPEEAATELERCIKSLKFVGAMVDGTTNGEFLDQAKFRPVFEAAQALDVPIYLHPAVPPMSVMESYYAGLPGDTGFQLAIAGWGWHAELGLHILRLIVSGIFDQLPRLKIIIGHMGEGVPYALARSSKVLEPATEHLSMTVAEYFKRNVYVTTSGYFTLPPLRCALDVLGKDRLMFSVDYPFSSTTQGCEYLEQIARSELFTDEDLENLAHGNAEKLLKLQTPASLIKLI